MPDRALTPGAIQSSDTAAICTPGWAEAHRDVSYATEDDVAREYGLSSHDGYEIDHLIPLELGGSNAVANLWPEPYDSPYGATQKDGLEDYLHDQVCHHGLPLATAQHEIAANCYAAWVSAGRPTPQDFGYSTGPDAGALPSPAPSPAPSSVSRGPVGGRRRLVLGLRGLQLLLRRLRRLRALEPARPDGYRQRRRVVQELAHRQLRLRRRLPARAERRQSDERDGRRRVVLSDGKRMIEGRLQSQEELATAAAPPRLTADRSNRRPMAPAKPSR